MSDLLAGLRILVLEDEFLIAMDVEQLCRDHGAADVVILRSIEELGINAENAPDADAAVIDVMLRGAPTFDSAERLRQRGVPFVFASGYADLDEVSQRFPGVALVSKPYAGDELVQALAAACGR